MGWRHQGRAGSRQKQGVEMKMPIGVSVVKSKEVPF